MIAAHLVEQPVHQPGPVGQGRPERRGDAIDGVLSKLSILKRDRTD